MARLAGLGEVAPATTQKTGTDWGAVLPSVFTGIVQARYTDKVLRENINRERAGLKPLDVENYQAGMKFGIDANTRKMLMGLSLVTVLVIGGVMYASRTKKKSRA